MTSGSDTYTMQEFHTYLQQMEQAGRDWLREQLSDGEFLSLYHGTFFRCIHLAEDDTETPPSPDQAVQIAELLRDFRQLRKLLDSIDFTIREFRKYGQSETDLIQKITVLSRCLVQLDFEYRPVRADSHDPLPPPAASL